jgi:hypothetical protein
MPDQKLAAPIIKESDAKGDRKLSFCYLLTISIITRMQFHHSRTQFHCATSPGSPDPMPTYKPCD